MCSGGRVCLVTQPYMLSSWVPWNVRPESTQQTIYARVAAAKLRMNLRLWKNFCECNARSEMHSPKENRSFENRLRSHVEISVLFAKMPRY